MTTVKLFILFVHIAFHLPLRLLWRAVVVIDGVLVFAWVVQNAAPVKSVYVMAALLDALAVPLSLDCLLILRFLLHPLPLFLLPLAIQSQHLPPHCLWLHPRLVLVLLLSLSLPFLRFWRIVYAVALLILHPLYHLHLLLLPLLLHASN